MRPEPLPARPEARCFEALPSEPSRITWCWKRLLLDLQWRPRSPIYGTRHSSHGRMPRTGPQGCLRVYLFMLEAVGNLLFTCLYCSAVGRLALYIIVFLRGDTPAGGPLTRRSVSLGVMGGRHKSPKWHVNISPHALCVLKCSYQCLEQVLTAEDRLEEPA